MQMQPSIDVLLKNVDSKYTMVVAAAKRARQLQDGQPSSIESRSNKPVTIALEELAAGQLEVERVSSGIK